MRALARAFISVPARQKWPVLWWGLAIAFLIAFPHWASKYSVVCVIEIAILVLYAMSYNLLFGFGGMVSFGHGMFFAGGAYGMALTMRDLGLGFWSGMLAGCVCSALIAALVGPFLVRVTSLYFAMLSLAFGQIFYLVVWKWDSFTRGDSGIQGLVRPEFFENQSKEYYFYISILAVSALFLYFVVRTPFGWCLQAVQGNRKRAQFIGINIKQTQIIALSISGFFTGLAGCLSYINLTAVTPIFASLDKSFEPLFSCIMGGAGFYGPIVGSVLLKMAQWLSLSLWPGYWPLIMGSTFVLVSVFWWGGVVARLQDPRWQKWLWVPWGVTIRMGMDLYWFLRKQRTR